MTFFIITIAITELFNIVFYLEYRFSDLYCQSIEKLMNDKYLENVILVTEDDIQVRAHKIILSSSSIL